MAENLYQDKSVDSIKEDIKNKFKDIEKSKWLPERDDQEIYSAAIDTINAYIQEIKATKEVYGPWALKEFSDLKKEFANTHNTLKGIRICTKNENKALINDVANKIDNAEKVVLERLARNRKHKEISNANQKLEKQEGKSFFIFDKNTDQYIFTAESNKPTIHTVLGKFFTEDTNMYTIDYSQCKNQRIKNKMIDLLGGISKCLIKYNKRSGTYNLINNGKILPERALIWEGVSLKTAESKMVEAQAKIRKNNDTGPIYKRSQFERSPKYNQLKDLIPVKLKKRIPEEDLWKFISETEKRLDTIIREQKKLGWELEQDEPISKKGRSQMESHFINTSGASKDVIIWENNNVIGESLYDILSDERDAYKTYLTARIKTKRGEADHLTKRRQIFSGANEKSPEADPQSREHFSYGLSMFSKLVNKLEDTHGTSQEVAALKVAIRNYQHSLEHGRPSQSDLNTAIAHLQTLFINYKSNDGSFSRITDATAKEKIKSLLIGDKTTAQRMIRELGSSLNVLGNNSTTFLRDEIADNEGIGFENTDYNQAFKNIATQLDFQENESEENQKKKMQLIDQLYQNIDSAESVFSFLKSKGMLPKSADYKNEAIKEGCKKIQQALAEKQKQMNNLEYNEASFREKLEQEKLSLEARMDALSDEERIRYQTISVTLENPAILQESLENAKNMAVLSIKYGGIASLLRGSLAFAFAKNGGKMVGTNADIFNSSHGLNGFLNFSDETVVWMGELGQMLIEELAIAIVAIALGAVTGGAGAVAVYAGKAALTAAKAARIANKANKIRKSFSLIGKLKSAKKYRRIGRETQKLMHAKSAINSLKTGTRIANKLDKTGKVAKGLKYADKLNDARNTLKTINQANTYVKLNDLAKVGKITNYLAKGSHLVFEGVGFHLSSTVLRNAFHGNELSTGINPWGYSEGPNGEHISNFRGYVQSIAFLGLLKAIGQPLQSLTGAGIQKILGEKYAPSMLGKVFHNIGSVGGELGSLMLAEQGIHLISEWEFAPVTGESLVQSLGLILGLRAYGFGKMKISKFKMRKKGLDQMTVEEGEKKITTDGNGQVIASNTAEVPVGSDLLSSPKTSHGKRYMPRERVRYENTKPKTEAKIQELQAQNAKKHQDLLHKKAELEKRIQDLKQQRKTNWETLPQQTQSSIQDIYKILQKGNIITIKGLKYQFNGVKNGKAEFIIESNAKKSAESSGKKVSEKLEVNSLIELKETHFNLEPGNKTTNSGRNAKLQELLEKNQKAESLKDLNRKINNKNIEINQISQKIHNLETQPNNPAFNEYFSSNVHKLFGKTVVIDGVAYKAKRTLNEDGALNFMYQGKGNGPLGADFSISSMKQLFEKGAKVYGFDFGLNPDGTVNNRARELTAREKETHAILQELKKGENNYLEKRSTTKNEYLNTYKNQLQQAKSELQALEAKKTLSEERQKQIHTRRDKGAELNKELRKVEAELERTNSEIKECERLETKYGEDLKSTVKDSEQINQKRTKEQDGELRQEAKELQENKPQSAENKSESGDTKPQATEAKSQSVEAKSQSVDFHKNDTKGFEEILQRYTQNKEKMLVGEGKNIEISKSEIMNLLIEKGFSPKHKVKVDGLELFLSDCYNDGGHPWIVGYTTKGEMRMFYKSESEGIWRSTDGSDGPIISKAQYLPNGSYETTTQVDFHLGKIFDTIPLMQIKQGMQSPLHWIGSLGYKYGLKRSIKYFLRPSLESEVKIHGNKRSAVEYYHGRDIADVKKMYENYDVSKYLKLEKVIDTYSFSHQHLGNIHVDIVRGKLNGKEVNIHFAHAVNNEPNSIFIIRGDIVNSKLSTFGIPSEQLNLGPLTAKPLDYVEQAPSQGQGLKQYGPYVDIRPLYQDTPLIKEYKSQFSRDVKNLSNGNHYEGEVKIGNIQFTNGPKNLSKYSIEELRNKGIDSKEMRESFRIADEQLKGLKERGEMYDQQSISGNFLGEHNVKYHGTYHGRPIVEVVMPNGQVEYFYKSTGFAGKAGTGIGGTTEGLRQPFGGIMNHPQTTDGWLIKDAGYKNYYGSKTYEMIANSLDNILMNKMGANNVSDLNIKIGLKNLNHPIVFTP